MIGSQQEIFATTRLSLITRIKVGLQYVNKISFHINPFYISNIALFYFQHIEHLITVSNLTSYLTLFPHYIFFPLCNQYKLSKI